MKEKLKFLERFLNYSIEYNSHKLIYQSAKDYLEENYDDDEIIEKDKIILNNVLYEIIVYTKTPIGFVHVAGYELDEVLDKIIEGDMDD